MRTDAAKVDPKQAHVVAQWPAGQADRLLPIRAEGPLPLLRARKLDRRAIQPGRRQESVVARRSRFVGILTRVLAVRRDVL